MSMQWNSHEYGAAQAASGLQIWPASAQDRLSMYAALRYFALRQSALTSLDMMGHACLARVGSKCHWDDR